MGIATKNIKMPTSCADCSFMCSYVWWDERAKCDLGENILSNMEHRPKECPLVEVDDTVIECLKAMRESYPKDISFMILPVKDGRPLHEIMTEEWKERIKNE